MTVVSRVPPRQPRRTTAAAAARPEAPLPRILTAPPSRRAIECIEDAIAQLEKGGADDRERAVHEALKDVKKTRALLRLYRSGLGDATYRHENRELRDAGRALSVMRDAHVRLETVDGLAERYAGEIPAGAFDALRERIGGPDVSELAVDQSVDAARRGWPGRSAASRTGRSGGPAGPRCGRG
jgi:hypothetical protein